MGGCNGFTDKEPNERGFTGASLSENNGVTRQPIVVAVAFMQGHLKITEIRSKANRFH